MSYLRFSPDEYRALCRLAEQIPRGGMGLSALQHFLVANLPLAQLDLANRVARLDDLQMQLLHEHLQGQSLEDALAGEWDGFTEAELEAVADAWESFPYPRRFLRYFRRPLVHLLSDGSPDLARKLATLSERQFWLLFEYVRGRRGGAAERRVSSLLKKAVWHAKGSVFLGDFEGRSAPERLVQQAVRQENREPRWGQRKTARSPGHWGVEAQQRRRRASARPAFRPRGPRGPARPRPSGRPGRSGGGPTPRPSAREATAFVAHADLWWGRGLKA